jgi:S-adenosylmethionine-dependent methyltransferase
MRYLYPIRPGISPRERPRSVEMVDDANNEHDQRARDSIRREELPGFFSRICTEETLRKWIPRMLWAPNVPSCLSRQFRQIDESALDRIKKSLLDHHFRDRYAPRKYASTTEFQKDLANHLTGRLTQYRERVIPWLNCAKPLRKAKILEIGCGTGPLTVALCEQDACVTAIDMDEVLLLVAKQRCSEYGLHADFVRANSTEIDFLFRDRHFDFVIFSASLEHMTHEERMKVMKSSYSMLQPGDLWCVVEATNRLWYSDGHTTLLPFFLWLPDDLALKYSQFSSRRIILERIQESEDPLLEFLRQGRGVSFHEFELTMKPVDQLDIVSCLSFFLRRQHVLNRLHWRFSQGYAYERFLSSLSSCPPLLLPTNIGHYYTKDSDLITLSICLARENR